VAFLIEKIEGREKCKSASELTSRLFAVKLMPGVQVLGGMYPCLQPSDSVGFRSNVAKYMEALRATVTRPALAAPMSKVRAAHSSKASHAASTSSKAKSSKNSQSGFSKPTPCTSPDDSPHPVAWWWSAIVVRKSLLEECSGDRCVPSYCSRGNIHKVSILCARHSFEKLLLALSTHALFVQIPPGNRDVLASFARPD